MLYLCSACKPYSKQYLFYPYHLNPWRSAMIRTHCMKCPPRFYSPRKFVSRFLSFNFRRFTLKSRFTESWCPHRIIFPCWYAISNTSSNFNISFLIRSSLLCSDALSMIFGVSPVMEEVV